MADFTTLEMIAGAVIALTLTKLVVFTVSAPAWLDFAEKFYARPAITSTVSVVLAGAVLYALVGAGVTIIQILAVTAMVSLLMMASLATFGTQLIGWARALEPKAWLREQWLPVLFWTGLMLWGLSELALTPAR